MSLSFLLRSFADETKPEKKKSEPSLAGILQRQRLKLKKTKKKIPQSLNFNPSTISFGFCHRAKVAHLAGLVDLYRDLPTPKEELTMDMGTAIHTIIQGYFWDCGILEGSYKCIKCEKTFYSTSPTTCPYVKSHGLRHLRFREVTLKDKVYQISGRADGIVLVEWNKEMQRHLFDIKSIKNKQLNTSEREFCFEDLIHGPKPDHLIQINLYMRMAELQQAHLLYVSKNTHQVKSFYLEYEPEKLAPYLKQIALVLEWAEEIKSGDRVDLPDPCDKEKCKCENYNVQLVHGKSA